MTHDRNHGVPIGRPRQRKLSSGPSGLCTYTLVGKEPKRCEDYLEWGEWLEMADRQVAIDTIGGVRVSTIFLGIDHNWHTKGPPRLFETMIFGGSFDQKVQRRYATWAEAEEGHARILAMLKAQ